VAGVRDLPRSALDATAVVGVWDLPRAARGTASGATVGDRTCGTIDASILVTVSVEVLSRITILRPRIPASIWNHTTAVIGGGDSS